MDQQETNVLEACASFFDVFSEAMQTLDWNDIITNAVSDGVQLANQLDKSKGWFDGLYVNFNDFEIFEQISDDIKPQIKTFYIFNDTNITEQRVLVDSIGELITASIGNLLLFITSDDTVYCFATNKYGLISSGYDWSECKPKIIRELCENNIKEFFNGFGFILALSYDKQVYGWGRNTRGQLGRGCCDEYMDVIPKIINLRNDRIDKISCGHSHTMALSLNGQVYGWGDNSFGQIGCGIMENNFISEPIVLKSVSSEKFKYILCHNNSSFALTRDGRVYSWGQNNDYILGEPNAKVVYIPKQIQLLNKIERISVSQSNSYFLNSEGFIYFFGKTGSTHQKQMKRLTELKFYDLIHIKNYLNLMNFALKSTAIVGSILQEINENDLEIVDFRNFYEYYAKKYKITYQTIDIKTKVFIDHYIYSYHSFQFNEEVIFERLSELIKFKIKSFYIFDDQIGNNILFITTDDRVYGIGANVNGCLGIGHALVVMEPQLITELCYQNIKEFFRGNQFLLALNNNNKVFAWGHNNVGQLGRGYDSVSLELPEIINYFENINITSISCGESHSLALSSDGVVYGWGNNYLGQLGCDMNEPKFRSTPFNLEFIDVINSIYCHDYSSFALTNTGLVYSWGSNAFNNLGHNMSSDECLFRPKLIINLFNINIICCSSVRSFFINKDNTLYYCGAIDQVACITPKLLTDEVIIIKLHQIPTHEAIHTNVLALSEQCVYKLNKGEIIQTKYKTIDEYYLNELQVTYKTINKLDNNYSLSQFNISKYIPENIRQTIKSYYIFNSCIELGIEYKNNILFITSDDKVYGIGSNNFGCLGFGNNMPINEPQVLPELCGQSICQFIHGIAFMCAISDDNQVYSWGRNNKAQLGMGYVNYSDECIKPAKMAYFANKRISNISCGLNHSLALTSDGEVYGWGDNINGQIGCGEYESNNISTPVQIKFDLSHKISHILCFINSSFALTCDGLVYSWGHNDNNRLGHDIENNIFLYKPKLIDLNNITHICCSERNTYFSNNEGHIYFCGFHSIFEKLPKEFTKMKVDNIHQMKNSSQNSLLVAFESENTIYHLGNNNEIEQSQYDNISDVYLRQFRITYQTIHNKLIQDSDIINVQNIPKEIMEYMFLENYDVMAPIGSGSFGSVFKVKDKSDDNLYAMKAIKIRDKNDYIMTDIEKELGIMKKIKNAYCVEYFDSFKTMDYIYIKMELCQDSLKQIIKQKRSIFNRKAKEIMTAIEYFISFELFSELIEGVNYLHELNPPIIHRDLKPANVLISDNNSGKYIKICDFGLATLQIQESMTHTQEQGTPKYMAPEVIVGRKYDTRADVYSLGMMAQSLFDIDINDSISFTGEKDSIVDIKILSLIKVIETMIDPKYQKRPKCKEIIELSVNWKLNRNELIAYKLFDNNKDDLKENQMLLNIFRNRLQKLNISSARLRLLHDLDNIQKISPTQVTASPQTDDLMVWDAVIFGPKDTILEGAIFKLKLIFTEEYPFNCPIVKFISPIFHPNFKLDEIIPIVENLWRPTFDVLNILLEILFLLNEPDLDENFIANSEAFELYRVNRREYERQVLKYIDQKLIEDNDYD